MADTASERAVLCGLFQYGEDAYLDVADFLDSGSFTDLLNQIVWKCIHNLYEVKGMKKFDQASIIACANELGYASCFEKKADLQHVRSLMNGRVLLENVRKWAGQVRKLQVGRLLRDQLREAAVSIEDIKGTESIETILGLAKAVLVSDEVYSVLEAMSKLVEKPKPDAFVWNQTLHSPTSTFGSDYTSRKRGESHELD